MSIRNHLREKHANFYYNLEKNVEFSSGSLFSNQITIENEHIFDTQPINTPHEEIICEVVPDDACIGNFDISDETIQNFLEILLENGVKSGIAFKALKSLSGNIVQLFEGLFNQNRLTPDIFNELKYCTTNQDIFDKYLVKYFHAIYPDTINIAGTDNKNFMYFPFKETLLSGIRKFSSFSEICGNESNESIKSFFSAPQNRPNETIYIEIYCDDFQLANPLLSKKSLKNSITGIYFRILSKNLKKFSKKKFSHLLALCYTSTFKNNSHKIMQFLANQINPLIQNKFVANIGSETRFVNLKIGFFCTDSKEATFLLGLKYGFNHSDCCRFCQISREDFKKSFTEVENLKTHKWYLENFESLLNLDGENHICGIQTVSPVSFINADNFFELFPPCIDHDIFEGVVPKIAKFALEHFKANKLLSFVDFKKKINDFEFLGKDKKNFPTLSFEKIEQIRFTSSEGFTFIRFFPFFLQSVDLDDPVFKIVSTLGKIVLILMSNSLSSEILTILNSLIELFLKECSAFENLKMTIKFHHLTHYISNILKFGPPKTFRTINFESIHSILKKLIKSSQNWKDICYTIAMKYARLKVCDQEIQIKEIGIVEYTGILPDSLVNFEKNSIYSLKCLKIDNQVYTVNLSAIYTLINDAHFFLLIKQILKIDKNYFINGDVYDFYESEYNTIVLEPTGSQGLYLIGSADDSDISYDVYDVNSQKFIVPYFWI